MLYYYKLNRHGQDNSVDLFHINVSSQAIM